MTANGFLMQFQADILNAVVERPAVTDSTALGAATLAGLGVGLFTLDSLRALRRVEACFQPQMPLGRRERFYRGWQEAVARTLTPGR